MKKFLSSLTGLLFAHLAFSQYWQQQVDYTIDVTLNVKERSVDAVQKMVYTNNSPDTLDFIWFHVWPNAYRNDRTAFSDQRLENGDTKFYFSTKEERGYINRMNFQVNGITARIEDHPAHIDIIRVLLPELLLPGKQVTITTPFHVQLPLNISRGGYSGETFQLTQWYPKPAVYDKEGWHPMPYLDQGEFYSDFGSFDVRITVPADFVVAATGELQDAQEKQWLKTRTIGSKDSSAAKMGTKTLHYRQDQVHDFAWFASREFIVDADTLALPSGKVVDVFAFYHQKEAEAWKKVTGYAKDAVRFYSKEVAEYPYHTVSVVSGPQGAGGGMEYPTITLISPIANAELLDVVVAHEIGHNWFYGILASNERAFPWMDEGMNSFYETLYHKSKYGGQPKFEEILMRTKEMRRTDQAINTHSTQFSFLNYGLVAYKKTAMWMSMIEKEMGAAAFREMMQDYYNTWKFRHPQPGDFRDHLVQRIGKERADYYFSLLDVKGTLPGQELSGFKFVSLFKKGSIKSYLEQPAKNALLLGPASGFNSYDKFMAGLIITNYKLPPTAFSYLVIPMYAFGSGNITGLGKMDLAFHSNGFIRKTNLFVNAARFSMNDFKDSAGNKTVLQFNKLVPGIRFTFANSRARSNVTKYLQWKTYLIEEDELRFRRDTLITGTDTAIGLAHSTVQVGRYLNQLRFVFAQQRALYPYELQLQVEQSEDFIRPALAANFFFNYPKGGGLQARFFAGKFIYIGEKTFAKQFATSRYHLNMTGANGYEDYTYSDLFIGRNRFEGFASQQIMIRDGGFKVRTDLLAEKVGRTDDWLMAVNFSSSVPQKMNPLSVLPVKIPLHVYLDIGTHAAVWERNATDDRFLFNAGFHLPFFDGMFNLYIPVLYNSVYGDYFKSTITGSRFLKTMSFSINLDTEIFKRFNREAEF